MRNYYKVLEISEDASPEEIKKAYYKLIKQWHPDHNPHTPISDDMMKMFNEAYDVLSDPQKRQVYDESIRIKPTNVNEHTYSYKTQNTENVSSQATRDSHDFEVPQDTVLQTGPDFIWNKIFMIIFIPLGAFLLLYYAYSIYEVKSAHHWPTTNGKIFNMNKDTNKIIFTYVIKGKRYMNYEIVGNNYFTKIGKEPFIVYYEKNNPENSILDIDKAKKMPSTYVNEAYYGLGIISLIFGMFCLIEILYYQYKKKNEPQ